MKPTTAFTICTAFALAACAVPAPRPPLAGGWTASAVTDPDVRAAADFVASQLGSSVLGIANARSQVVAGRNFAFDLALADGRKVHAVVWRRLDGTFQLTEPVG